MTIEPTLNDARLDRRREHLMHEITLMRAEPDLAETPVPSRPRRTWRRSIVGGLVGAAASAVLATLLMTSSGTTGSGPSAFDIQRISNETVSVRIMNTRVAARAMNRQLREQGINAQIEVMPASPQLIGAWVYWSAGGDLSPAVFSMVSAQFTDGYPTTIELPTKFKGWITFGVGVPPEAGHAPQVLGVRNALAPNARLGCLHATDGDPATVRQAVEHWGYTVKWTANDGPPFGFHGFPVSAPAPGQRVVTAYIDDATPTQVELVLMTPGSARYLGLSRQGYGSTWDTRDTNPSTCVAAWTIS